MEVWGTRIGYIPFLAMSRRELSNSEGRKAVDSVECLNGLEWPLPASGPYPSRQQTSAVEFYAALGSLGVVPAGLLVAVFAGMG